MFSPTFIQKIWKILISKSTAKIDLKERNRTSKKLRNQKIRALILSKKHHMFKCLLSLMHYWSKLKNTLISFLSGASLFLVYFSKFMRGCLPKCQFTSRNAPKTLLSCLWCGLMIWVQLRYLRIQEQFIFWVGRLELWSLSPHKTQFWCIFHHTFHWLI